MKIVEDRRSGVLVLRPEGRLDSADSPALESAILGAIESGDSKLVVDLSGVDYISSRGLRVFVIGAKSMQAAGSQFAVCSLSGVVREVFDAVGFQDLVATFASADEAIASLAGEEAC